MTAKERETPLEAGATADLLRPGPPGLVGRTNRIIIASWLILWVLVGALVRIVSGELHGFFWGFVLAGLFSVFGAWFLYARPATRRACSAKLSWAADALTIFDHEGRELTRVSLGEPHRALLIRAKLEARVLLRVEQVDDSNRSGARIDLIGPLPMVLPLRPAGDARSLIGFAPGFGKNRGLDGSPFAMCASGREGDALMTGLLGFLNRHQDMRRDVLNLRAGNGSIKLDRRGFVIDKAKNEQRLDIDGGLRFECLARPFSKTPKPPAGAEVFIALVPATDDTDPIVFGMLATADWLEALPRKWDLPEAALDNRVLLYDDTPAAFVAKRELLRYALKLAPSNPVIELLRN